MNYRQILGLALLTLVAACTGRSRIAEVYPDVAQHAGAEIKAVNFIGGEPYGKDTLLVMIETQPTHCSLLGFPICLPFLSVGRQTRTVDPSTVVRDAGRLTVFYRREGYVGTRVTPKVEPEAEGDEDVAVTFIIRRGDPVILDTLRVEGLAGALDSAKVTRALPLQPGEMFDLDEFALSADHVLRELQSAGHAYSAVLRSYDADTLRDRASATITAIPGPIVRVDSIIVTGADELGRRAAIRQLGFQKGSILRLPTLTEAQRNLYSLEIVQLASVGIAPDSMQLSPDDSTTATIHVAIAEADEHQAEASAGFGSVECFRIDTDYVDRSFTGGGRRLAVNGSVSKIGLAGRTNAGLGGNVCSSAVADPVTIDTIGSTLDYRLAAEFTQPYFLSPRNRLTANLYSERLSEASIYQRQATGARFAVTHRLAPRTTLIGSVDVEKGRTIASPLLFCSAFQICTPNDIDRMTDPRFRNTIGANYLQDFTDHPLDPTRGHIIRSAVAWAAPWLSSDVTFVRWTGEGTIARIVRPGWVFAGSLRLGNFFQSASLNPDRNDDDFLPPEERFYAGGANSVRGFERNQMGAGVYVAEHSITLDDGVIVPAERIIEDRPDGQGKDTTFKACEACATLVPTGGTNVAIINAEIRFPSPIFRRQLRLAAFIDAGSLTTGNFWDLGGRDWKVTPGVGLRIITPVGPARVDMAYNPYSPITSTLYVSNGTNLVPVRTDFKKPDAGFFGKLKFHVAIGQAF